MKIMPMPETMEELEQEVEKVMSETSAAETSDTNEATKTLTRVFSDSQKGFEDRRISLENQIAIRQAELADIKIAIESINVALKSIEAGVSLNRSPAQTHAQMQGEKPTPTSGISMAKANAR